MKKLLLIPLMLILGGMSYGQAPRLQLRDTLVVPSGTDTTMTISLGEYRIKSTEPISLLFDYRVLSTIADTAGILDLGYTRSTADTMFVRFDDTRLPFYLCDTVNSIVLFEKFYVTRPWIRVHYTNAGATTGQKIVFELFK